MAVSELLFVLLFLAESSYSFVFPTNSRLLNSILQKADRVFPSTDQRQTHYVCSSNLWMVEGSTVVIGATGRRGEYSTHIKHCISKLAPTHICISRIQKFQLARYAHMACTLRAQTGLTQNMYTAKKKCRSVHRHECELEGNAAQHSAHVINANYPLRVCRIGGRVVRILSAAGNPVVAVVRDPTAPAAQALAELPAVRVARGDVLDADSLLAAVAGAAAVIDTHGLRPQRVTRVSDLWARDPTQDPRHPAAVLFRCAQPRQ